jgi:hypothetical protein
MGEGQGEGDQGKRPFSNRIFYAEALLESVLTPNLPPL